jgi:iron complex outermembrane receptor protein
MIGSLHKNGEDYIVTAAKALNATAALAIAWTLMSAPAAAQAPGQTAGTGPATAGAELPTEIVVTARKREETLNDVPVAASAITGDVIDQRGLSSVRDVATLAPGLNINSDAVGRAFVAIRGVGVTLVQTVQPGVGLFIDGIYQPNTSYLNNPLLDVERVEVLRGPQGTLYGKNTLGGAINVITRQPSNDLELRAIGSYAGPDDAWYISGAASGAIIPDTLQVRVAASHRQQDGFLRNTVIGGDANPLNTDSINGTIRAEPAPDVVLTVKGYYDWVKGASTPYARVTGPTDYSRNVQFNTRNLVRFEYKGVNGRLEVPVEALSTEVTLIGAYDERDSVNRDGEGDFGPLNIVRSSGADDLKTRTAELRFDSELSETLSSLVGLFYSRETTDATNTVNVIPLARVANTISGTEADTYAAFGTLFWRPSDAWEVAAGMRYDHEDREATGAAVIGGTVVPIPPARIKSDEVEPRLTVTRHWSDDAMTYASVARGYRGGGFNSPLAPTRTYKGDSVWTYEVGSKYTSPDRLFSINGALFYNDYSDYIGLNSIAPSPAGGLVTVDLNSGDVESYGAEAEFVVRPAEAWTVSGSITYVHARLTNTDSYTAITGRTLATDRLTFQPDWNFSLSSDYVVPVGNGELTFNAGLIGKGSRKAASISETRAPTLDEYFLVNGSVGYRLGGVELSVFVNNLFNEDYFDSYIEQTTLALAGLPASDLGIIGDRRRVGARVRINF